jgi:uncharacterized SAM-binding protein YcdF (DUF218 family)
MFSANMIESKKGIFTKNPTKCQPWVLCERKVCRTFTLRGWLFLLSLAVLASASIGAALHPFLAKSQLVQARVLVVEGWLPDYALQQAVTEFRDKGYERLIVIGGSVEIGASLSEYKTDADVGDAVLKRLGFDTNALIKIPGEYHRRGRTIRAALSVRDYIADGVVPIAALNVVTSGVHARRTKLVYQRTMGSRVRVGVFSVVERSYDPNRWWISSQGVRTVLDEALAYTYALFGG